MDNNKIINSRIIHKHDIESNWKKAVNFIPLKAEIIVYDIDDNYNYERFKIGDGVTLVNDLPFVSDNINLDNYIKHLGRISSLEDLRTTIDNLASSYDDDASTYIYTDEFFTDYLQESAIITIDPSHNLDNTIIYLLKSGKVYRMYKEEIVIDIMQDLYEYNWKDPEFIGYMTTPEQFTTELKEKLNTISNINLDNYIKRLGTISSLEDLRTTIDNLASSYDVGTYTYNDNGAIADASNIESAIITIDPSYSLNSTIIYLLESGKVYKMYKEEEVIPGTAPDTQYTYTWKDPEFIGYMTTPEQFTTELKEKINTIENKVTDLGDVEDIHTKIEELVNEKPGLSKTYTLSNPDKGNCIISIKCKESDEYGYLYSINIFSITDHILYEDTLMQEKTLESDNYVISWIHGGFGGCAQYKILEDQEIDEINTKINNTSTEIDNLNLKIYNHNNYIEEIVHGAVLDLGTINSLESLRSFIHGLSGTYSSFDEYGAKSEGIFTYTDNNVIGSLNNQPAIISIRCFFEDSGFYNTYYKIYLLDEKKVYKMTHHDGETFYWDDPEFEGYMTTPEQFTTELKEKINTIENKVTNLGTVEDIHTKIEELVNEKPDLSNIYTLLNPNLGHCIISIKCSDSNEYGSAYYITIFSITNNTLYGDFLNRTIDIIDDNQEISFLWSYKNFDDCGEKYIIPSSDMLNSIGDLASYEDDELPYYELGDTIAEAISKTQRTLHAISDVELVTISTTANDANSKAGEVYDKVGYDPLPEGYDNIVSFLHDMKSNKLEIITIDSLADMRDKLHEHGDILLVKEKVTSDTYKYGICTYELEEEYEGENYYIFSIEDKCIYKIYYLNGYWYDDWVVVGRMSNHGVEKTRSKFYYTQEEIENNESYDISSMFEGIETIAYKICDEVLSDKDLLRTEIKDSISLVANELNTELIENVSIAIFLGDISVYNGVYIASIKNDDILPMGTYLITQQRNIDNFNALSIYLPKEIINEIDSKFIPNILFVNHNSDGTIDKTYNEIKSAINVGKMVFVKSGKTVYSLQGFDVITNEIEFYGFKTNSGYEDSYSYSAFCNLTIASDGTTRISETYINNSVSFNSSEHSGHYYLNYDFNNKKLFIKDNDTTNPSIDYYATENYVDGKISEIPKLQPTTSLSVDSTNEEVPSAKTVYDYIKNNSVTITDGAAVELKSHSITATDGQTSFTNPFLATDNILIFHNGVLLTENVNYTVTDSTIDLLEYSASEGDNIAFIRILHPSDTYATKEEVQGLQSRIEALEAVLANIQNVEEASF